MYARYHIDTIEAARVINCKATRRGPVRELLVHHAAGVSRPKSSRRPTARTKGLPVADRD
jgi:hypothetical protein